MSRRLMRMVCAVLTVILCIGGQLAVPMLSATEAQAHPLPMVRTWEEDPICQIALEPIPGGVMVNVRGISPPYAGPIIGHMTDDFGTIFDTDVLNGPSGIPPGQQVYGDRHGTQWPLIGFPSGARLHYALYLVDENGVPIAGVAGIHLCLDVWVP